jgi:hypothetical protein
MREDDDLDLLLNSALSTYADPGVNYGLEQRILARVFSSGVSVEAARARSRRWLPWTLALVAAACLFLIAVFSVPRKRSLPVNSGFQEHESQQPLVAGAPIESPATAHLKTAQGGRPSTVNAHVRPNQAEANSAPLPKLDVFPTPQPLTPQEQALAVFAIQAPALELQALIEAQKQDDAPLSITAIEIQPLDPPGQGGN